VYRAWVFGDNGVYRGYLYQLSDSSVQLVSSPNIYSKNLKVSTYAVQSIAEIRFRRLGSVDRGTIIGGLAGVGLGVAIGFLSGDQQNCVACFTAEAKAIFLGLTLPVPTAVLGGLIGAKRRPVVLRRDINVYGTKRKELKRYLLRQGVRW
ncbi:MAG: hypothetical protein AAGI38_09240, partial [Bacteroidota bacterium]